MPKRGATDWKQKDKLRNNFHKMKYKFKKGEKAIFFHHHLLGDKGIDKFLGSYNGRAVAILRRQKDIYYCLFDNDKKTGVVPIAERDLRMRRHPLTTIFEAS